ncbi:hypothetical protein G6F56_011754 [Rhizopus delemar]|nr:hypothetical protein G6F56_011754 [Rhizopus delemar]
MTTVPLPIPYNTRPMIIIDRLAEEVELATKMLPNAIKTVVKIDPGIVPKASIKIPPIKGSTVLTIDTLDCIAPYCELEISNS